MRSRVPTRNARRSSSSPAHRSARAHERAPAPSPGAHGRQPGRDLSRDHLRSGVSHRCRDRTSGDRAGPALGARALAAGLYRNASRHGRCGGRARQTPAEERGRCRRARRMRGRNHGTDARGEAAGDRGRRRSAPLRRRGRGGGPCAAPQRPGGDDVHGARPSRDTQRRRRGYLSRRRRRASGDEACRGRRRSVAARCHPLRHQLRVVAPPARSAPDDACDRPHDHDRPPCLCGHSARRDRRRGCSRRTRAAPPRSQDRTAPAVSARAAARRRGRSLRQTSPAPSTICLQPMGR